MAILIEEEKKSSSISALLGWVIVAGMILASVYYVFFAPAPTVVVPPPPNYAAIAPMAQINLNPSGLLSSQGFQALKTYVAEPSSTGPAAVGRPNPFIAP
jgi:hypothetical protein